LRRINSFSLGHNWACDIISSTEGLESHYPSKHFPKDWGLVHQRNKWSDFVDETWWQKRKKGKVEQQGIRAVTLCCYSTEYAECHVTFQRKFRERITENPYGTEKLIGCLALT